MNSSPQSTVRRGRAAEAMAAAYLQIQGYEIAARNVRCGALEVDLIAQRGSLLVVAEVRFRTRPVEAALEALPPEKWRRLQRAAALAARPYRLAAHRSLRCDLIVIDRTPDGVRLRHIQGIPPRRPAD
jgi:putative endonuclease